MANRSIPVEIYTTSHRILGRVNPSASGLFSFLNIPTTSYLELEGAMLMRLHQPGKLIARYPTFYVVKSEIAAALLSSRSQLGPTSFARGGYSTTVPHWVRVIMGGYEVRGIVEAPGKFSFGGLMFEGERLFIPVFSASLQAILFPNVHAEAPAMLFNRRMVDGMALLSKDEIPAGSEPGEAD
jgi:hypothetical protein